MKTVFVGLSGGVDSSLAAHILTGSGYRVVGVYMKNWTASIGDWECPWRDDYLSAKRVAVELGIDFLVFDFETDYRRLVVDYLLADYQAGQTPNPDIRCNSQIKFKLFVKAAQKAGADLVATGHYARTDGRRLLRPVDEVKDQTYFLYRIDREVLPLVRWPLADLTKAEVRTRAADAGLSTANRPDSQGICFVGQIGLPEFLRAYLPEPPQPGSIIDAGTHKVLGRHPGAIFFTLGQRQGLGVGAQARGSGLPYYVVGKDMAKNEVYVSQKIDHRDLLVDRMKLDNCHWLADPAESCLIRYRHGGELYPAKIKINGSQAQVFFDRPLRATAPGQSVVAYCPDEGVVFGGGIVTIDTLVT